jgi:hypothetical protein
VALFFDLLQWAMIATIADPTVALAVAPAVWILGGLFAINAIGALAGRREEQPSGFFGELDLSPEWGISDESGAVTGAAVEVFLHRPGAEPQRIAAGRTDSRGMITLTAPAGSVPQATLFQRVPEDGYQAGVTVLCRPDVGILRTVAAKDRDQHPWLELRVDAGGDVKWSTRPSGVYGVCRHGSHGATRVVLTYDGQLGRTQQWAVADYSREGWLSTRILMRNGDVVYAPAHFIFDPLESIPEQGYYETRRGGDAAQRWFSDPQLRKVVGERIGQFGGFSDDTPRAIDVMLAMAAESSGTQPIFDSVYWGMIGNTNPQDWAELGVQRPGFRDFAVAHLSDFMELFHETAGEFELNTPFGNPDPPSVS